MGPISIFCKKCGNQGHLDVDGGGGFLMSLVVYTTFRASHTYQEAAEILGHEPITNPMQMLLDEDAQLTCRSCGSDQVEVKVEADELMERQDIQAIESMGEDAFSVNMHDKTAEIVFDTDEPIVAPKKETTFKVNI